MLVAAVHRLADWNFSRSPAKYVPSSYTSLKEALFSSRHFMVEGSHAFYMYKRRRFYMYIIRFI
jgi:hypothetical protein